MDITRSANTTADIGTVKKLMNKYNVGAKKSFGQNFLINPSIPNKTAFASANGADTCSNTGVIEIGPGMGALSWELCRLYKKVAAVEADRTLEPILGEIFRNTDNFKAIFGDILKTDLKDFAEREFYAEGIEKINVCANLPYYITTPVIEYLLSSSIQFGTITLMVQKEAADKLCAMPDDKNYGAITLLVNYAGKIKKLFNVSPSNFYPSPKITSSVIQIVPHGTADKYSPKNERILFKIIRAAFEQRRKTLVNALSSVFDENTANKMQLADIVKETAGDANIRGEALGIAAFVNIADMLFSLMQK